MSPAKYQSFYLSLNVFKNGMNAWTSCYYKLLIHVIVFASNLKKSHYCEAIKKRAQGTLLLTWFNFNPSMDK